MLSQILSWYLFPFSHPCVEFTFFSESDYGNGTSTRGDKKKNAVLVRPSEVNFNIFRNTVAEPDFGCTLYESWTCLLGNRVQVLYQSKGL